MIDMFRIQPNAPQNITTIVNQHDGSYCIRSDMLNMTNDILDMFVPKLKYPQFIVSDFQNSLSACTTAPIINPSIHFSKYSMSKLLVIPTTNIPHLHLPKVN